MKWQNLYPACLACMRASGSGLRKGRRFPLADESKRAWQAGEEKREKPILLDPCTDEPAKHLYFAEDGNVFGLSERGIRTILEFDLNRAALVKERQLVAKKTAQFIDRIRYAVNVNQQVFVEQKELFEQWHGELASITSGERGHAAVARQHLYEQREEMLDLGFRISMFGENWYRVMAETPSEVLTRAREDEEKLKSTNSNYTLRSAKGRELFKTQRRLLASIEITNLRGIRELSLKISDLSDSVTPWLTVLGENGVGKSTVLQATAIALAGPTYYRKLLETKSFDERGFIRSRCKFGEVSVQLSSFKSPHRVRFTPEGAEFRGPNGEEAVVRRGVGSAKLDGKPYPAPTVLVAYGATRLIPGPGTKRYYGPAFSRIDNLFDPLVPLVDPRKTLMELSEEHFDHAADVIKELLNLPRDAALKRASKKGVFVRLYEDDIPLSRLSDGYQGVIGLVVDMLGPLYKTWDPISSAQGVVIVDEIGTHLHPTWRMRIVRGLRNALPGMQFITSTHDPLCLRGLGHGEVAVLQRGSKGVITALTDLPSPADFRVEQLLTSEFFGLNSTLDPDAEDVFKRYFELLNVSQKSDAQRKELAAVKRELDRRRQLGETPRDRVMYRVIDKLLAKKSATTTAAREEVAEEAASLISKLWKQVDE